MKAATNTAQEPFHPGKGVTHVFAGLIVGLIISVVFLFIFALVMTMRDIPQGAVPTLSILSGAFGSAAGGFFGARKQGKSGLLTGAIIGLILFLVLMLAGLAFKTGSFGASVLIKLFVTLASGGIGGILGVNSRRRK